MKINNLILWGCLAICYLNANAQDNYKKRYYIPTSINYTSENACNACNHELKIKVKDSVIVKSMTINDKVVEVKDTINREIADWANEFEIKEYKSYKPRLSFPRAGRIKANIKFEEKYVYINPWLFKNPRSPKFATSEHCKVHF